MTTLTPLVIQDDSEVYGYAHPYLLTKASTNAVKLWSCSNASEPPAMLATLDVAGLPVFPYLLSPNRILLHESIDPGVSSWKLSVYSVPEAKLLDSLQLGPATTDGAATKEPQPGYAELLGVVDGHIAVWTNGSTASDGYIKVYALSNEGKLTVVRELRPASDTPPLHLDPTGSTYRTPELVHLTPEYFVGSLTFHPDPTAHLIRWSSSSASSAASHAELPCTRVIPDFKGTMNVALKCHVAIPASNAILVAHYEYPLDFNDQAPVTVVRSIDAQTLKVNWSRPLNQSVDTLSYSASSGVVLAIGQLWDDAGAGWGITALDARTGDAKRSERIGEPMNPCGSVSHGEGHAACALAPSGDHLVVVFGDGQLATCPVAAFVEGGLPRALGADGQGAGKVVTRPCAEVELAVPRNSKERSSDKKARESGRWRWVDRVFFGEEQVIVKPASGTGFAAVRWK